MIFVGAAGHRVLADPVKIRDSVDAGIGSIVTRYPGEPLTVISALAEGADRIIAESILEHAGSELVAVLPFPSPDYVRDFTSSDSESEFANLLSRAAQVVIIEPHPTRDDAYEAAANYVLIHADILVTVWDGRPAQGRTGTAYTVERARRMGLPVAWVKSGNRTPGTMQPTRLEHEEGVLVLENF